ncbi:Homeodomain-like protein [Annulohypoxylon bovei var. microspora]|nr:Homeodomain-like protein [Annulohypoxylon bovei var. microspora]
MESQSEAKHQRRGPWSQREDELLRRYVAIQGPLCWVRISAQIGTRSSKQCRERYHQNLKPSLNHNPITPEEGAQIEEMVSKVGKRWAEIARSLNNRSDNAVKNWWNGSMNRRKRLIRRQTSSVHDPLSPNQSQSPYYSQAATQLPQNQHQDQHQDQHQYHQAAAAPSTPASHYKSSHHKSYQSTSLWGSSSGLPSPSLTSPSVEPQDLPPLASSSGSKLGATYPASSLHEPLITLPPLRIGNGDLPTSKLPTLDPTLPQSQSNYSNARLPTLRNLLGSSQLPTAPSSPRDHSPGPRTQLTAQASTHEGDQGNNNSPRKLSTIYDLLS